MSIAKIDALQVKEAFLSAAAALDSQKDWINELNVFPVPDGDTGTNMTLTIMSAAKDVARLDRPDMETVCKSISAGSLRGARGNSGVILSQLLSGFCKTIKEHRYLEPSLLAIATQKAVETAYKAVMKPKEGTILTVARAMSDKAVELAYSADDLETMIAQIIEAGNDMLQKTPELLPVLKQAGVVDSGGQGLMVVVQGAYDALLGKGKKFEGLTSGASSVQVSGASRDDIETADIKFGYCTEFIINASLDEAQEKEFKAFLESIGDSIVCVSDDDLTKIHVHTNDPGQAISRALTFGELSRLKIDNMREEHNELYTKELSGTQEVPDNEKNAGETQEPRKPYGIISVSVGEGLSEIFKSLGADYIIEGGQTMNPSTDDVLDAIDHVNADNIFVLPNNKNIILAANQAAELTEDKNIVVISSFTIPQGITAILNYSEDMSIEENVEAMENGISSVDSAEVTYAIRDTVIDDFKISADDIMVIGDRGMLAVNADMKTAVMSAFEQLINDDSSLVNIYYGEGVSKEDAEALAAAVEERFPDVDVTLNYGGQPVYYYFISVE